MDISTLVPLPVCISPGLCERNADVRSHCGKGVAVCADLGLLVISSSSKLHVFALPEDIIARSDLGTPWELAHVRTLGGVAPMEFGFCNGSGHMAFTDGCCGEATTTPLVLVTETGKSGRGTSAVHVIDVVRGTHVGYVAAPGTIILPFGVAARKSLAAISCWKDVHTVRVFEGSSGTWTAVRKIAADALGLRFTADGLGLVVADYFNGRVSIFCAKDGSFLRHIALLPADVYPRDVEQCVIDDGSTGWVICHSSGLLAVADTDAGTVVAKRRDVGFYPLALAVVPGLGLLVLRHDTGVHFLATPDAVAMAAMSACKVAWMVSVCRGLGARRLCDDFDLDQETLVLI